MLLKNLTNAADRHGIVLRLKSLTPQDVALWGRMNVHEMVCHLDDAYKVVLGLKRVSPASGLVPRTIIKSLALRLPLRWPRGVPTRPEVEQGKGGSLPVDFHEDLASLLGSLNQFCVQLPRPLPDHPMFGSMTDKDWRRWGYLHADHHLRQFGR